MSKLSKAVIAALIFGGSISTATAGGVITGVEAINLNNQSFKFTLDSANHTLDIFKTLGSLDPVELKFTVAHQNGSGGAPYTVTEHVTNDTGQAWSDFHYSITEPDHGNGVVFTSFQQSTFGTFTLDNPPSSGPRDLNFTGSLADQATADASFKLSPFDPGNGKTSTFTVTQMPSVSPIPEPETYAMMLAGLLLMGGIAKRRSNKSQG